MRRPSWLLVSVAAAALLLPDAARALSATITVTGTVNESGGTVTVNGVTAPLTGTTFTAAGVPLALGPNTITATATDAAGNATSASITVHLGAKVNVQGTRDSSVTTVTINGVTATLGAGTFSALVPMTLGVNTITVNAADAAGNTNTAASRAFLARPPVEHP